MIPGTYYVPDTNVPGISRRKSIRTYVVVRMIPTFRPWTHTSDDRYIYQLSLVLATATAVSFVVQVFWALYLLCVMMESGWDYVLHELIVDYSICLSILFIGLA